MKKYLSIACALLAGITPLCVAAEESQNKCCFAEMKGGAATTCKEGTKNPNDDLDDLVKAMNGSIGKDKLEAMAAIVTRLVERTKAPSSTGTAAPAEVHHH
jgi:hypothetical protein